MQSLVPMTPTAGLIAIKNATAIASSLVSLIGWRREPPRGISSSVPYRNPLPELTGLQGEVQRLSRERSFIRFENQLLHEIVHRTDATEASEALLHLLIPQSSIAFGAVLDVFHGRQVLVASRGLTEASRQSLEISPEHLNRLVREPWVKLKAEDLGPAGSAGLGTSDLRKARKIWLFAMKEGGQLESVLVASALWPPALSQNEQLRLLSRSGSVLARLLNLDRDRRRRERDLKQSQEMLTQQSIANQATIRPFDSLGDLTSRLQQAAGMDRAALFLSSRRMSDLTEPVIVSGMRLPPVIESAWRQHESTLATQVMAGRIEGLLDTSALRERGIDGLVGSAGAWPLRHDGRLLGSIVLSRQASEVMSSQQLQLCEWSVGLISRTLFRVYDDALVRRQARHDGLTDLANRRTFDSVLAGEIDRVRMGVSSECSLLLADLDRFKSINDTHGHAAGDEVLRIVAQLLRDRVGHMRVGERSLLARYGGEELAILLPGVGLTGALRLAEEIRHDIASRQIAFHDAQLNVTVSIGAAACPRHAMTPRDLVTVADNALYRAKSEGRNRVCIPLDS